MIPAQICRKRLLFNKTENNKMTSRKKKHDKHIYFISLKFRV